MMLKSGTEVCSNGWSVEYDSLPLSARLKLLRSRKQRFDSVYLRTLTRGQCESVNKSSNVDGEENGCFSSEEENMLPGHDDKRVFQASDCCLNDQSPPSSSGFCVISHGDSSYEGMCTASPASSSEFLCNDDRSPVSDLTVSTLQHPALSNIPTRARNEYKNATQTFCLKSSTSSGSACTQGTNAKYELFGDFDGDLENIVLSERRQMLLSRLLVKSQMPCIQIQDIFDRWYLNERV